jgi:hypothetical protein
MGFFKQKVQQLIEGKPARAKVQSDMTPLPKSSDSCAGKDQKLMLHVTIVKEAVAWFSDSDGGHVLVSVSVK